MEKYLFDWVKMARWRGRWAGLAGLPLLLAGLLSLAGPARAQLPTNPQQDPNFNPAAPVVVRPDTATVRKPNRKQRRELAAADSARRTERLFGLRVTRPQKAGLLALIPSGGQLYNRRYWKLPIVYGMVGGLGYWVYFQQTLYRNLKVAKDASDIGPKALAALTEKDLDKKYFFLKDQPPATINNNLNFARTYRDLSILLSALGYGLQVLDAVVDAHLRDFDVGDDLSLQLRPVLLPVPGEVVPATGLALTLRLK